MSNFKSILTESCALTKTRPLIVGVSGGADSLCLMDLLREAGYALIVAHFDHQLREESHDDANMVKRLCASFNLECVIGTENVRAYSQDKKLSIEEAARELRYQFMFNLAREKNAQAVAVGHTADDQVETVLMHILRGSSLNGLKGMSHRAVIQTFDAQIPIVRPLLEMTRAETVAHCVAHHLHPHYDASNDSLEYKRNKIRHQLIPALETYNPKVREALLRMSQTLKDDADLVDSLVDSAWQDCASTQSGFVAFDVDLLPNYAAGLQRHLVKRAMRTLLPDVDVTYEILHRAVNVVASAGRESIPRTDLKSGLYMFREGNRIYICRKDAELPLNLFPQMKGKEIAVAVPSVVELANGWKLIIEYAEHVRAQEIFENENPLEAWFDADALTNPLCVRIPRRADRIIPLGMESHSKKISDLFVNEKIPQRARENWVLLCSGADIIWAAGIRAAHFCRVTEKTKRVIHVVTQA